MPSPARLATPNNVPEGRSDPAACADSDDSAGFKEKRAETPSTKFYAAGDHTQDADSPPTVPADGQPERSLAETLISVHRDQDATKHQGVTAVSEPKSDGPMGIQPP
jgi:hypothetical protein